MSTQIRPPAAFGAWRPRPPRCPGRTKVGAAARAVRTAPTAAAARWCHWQRHRRGEDVYLAPWPGDRTPDAVVTYLPGGAVVHIPYRDPGAAAGVHTPDVHTPEDRTIR